jgi:hypothetical protein
MEYAKNASGYTARNVFWVLMVISPGNIPKMDVINSNLFQKNNIKNQEMKNLQYVIGRFYDDKGIYLGIIKGKHKFQRHTADKSFKEYGPKYHYEKP